MIRHLTKCFVGILTLTIIQTVIPGSLAHAEEVYVEPGRYGVQWSVTEDTVFLGASYKSDTLDAIFNFSGHSFTDGAPANNYVINARFGYRYNLGSHNYLAMGALANVTVIGTDYGSGVGASFNDNSSANTNSNGINIAGSGRIGPYIGIQRHFAHSGVYLELVTMPFAWQTSIMNTNGNKVVAHDVRFLESGYVGVGYLFGTSGDDLKKAD